MVWEETAPVNKPKVLGATEGTVSLEENEEEEEGKEKEEKEAEDRTALLSQSRTEHPIYRVTKATNPNWLDMWMSVE